MKVNLKLKEYNNLTIQIENILDNFNFEKVRKTMKTLGWTYRYNLESPSIQELRKTAKLNLKTVAFNVGCTTSSSGGFVARMFDDCHLFLCFVVAEYDAREVSTNKKCRNH